MAAKPIFVQAVDTNGTPYSGAKLNVYDAGTTTPRAIYTESGLGTASANPAIADANGVVVVWVNDAGGDIKVTLTNSAETVTPHNEDNVPIASLTCYPVITFQGDQSLLTTSSPTFAGLTLGNVSFAGVVTDPNADRLVFWDDSAGQVNFMTLGTGLAFNGTSLELDGDLQDISGLTPTDGGVIIGDGTDFVVESGAALRTSIGVAIGSDVLAYDANLQAFVNVFTAPTVDGVNGQFLKTDGAGNLTFATPSGGGDLLASLNLSDLDNTATARTNLGVAIGSDVQAYDAGLASIAGLTTAADKMIYTTASNTYAVTDLSSFARTVLDDANANAARTTLELNTKYVANISALKALTGGDFDKVDVGGHTDANDGGGGTFIWDGSDTTTDDNGVYIQPNAGGTGRWIRRDVSPLNVKAYGARGDFIRDEDGAITSSDNTFTSANAAFTSDDVGKLIYINGAGAAGAVLSTTIASYTSSTEVELTDAASTTVSGAVYYYATDDTTEIQAAIDFVFNAGGGELFFPKSSYLFSSTLTVGQRVFMVGEGGFFKNQYTNDEFEAGGSALIMAPGSNANGIRFRYDAAAGETIADYRLNSGIRHMVIHGLRSESQATGSTDLNSSGYGIYLQGARYIRLDSVLVTKWAQDGLRCESYDYGTGALSCNNLDIRGNAFLSNAGRGCLLTAGDSIFTSNQVGYNGSTGLSVAGFGVCSNNLIWNNQGDGVTMSATNAEPIFVSNKVYDNADSGVVLSSGGCTIVGCNILRNNTAGNTGSAADRSGIYIASTDTEAITIVGNSVGNDGGATDQDYGIYFADAATRCEGFGGNNLFGNVVDDLFLTDKDNIRYHEATTSLSSLHPGFTAEGDINMDGNGIIGVQDIAGNTWGTVSSISSGSVACNRTFVAMNVSGGGTVTDITSTVSDLPILIIRNSNATAITFEYNSSKLRLINQSDVSLAQSEAIMLVYVSGTVWQQVGGKFNAAAPDISTLATESGTGVTINTTPSTLFDASESGAMYDVYAAHTGGNVGAHAIVMGDPSTPVIISQNSGGANTFTYSVSGTNIQLASASSAFTSNWSAFRKIKTV